jgi:two-component system sensor histidine kinase KdpD
MAREPRETDDKRPNPEELLDRINLIERERTQSKAWLRIYLGYAPGVGKTYAMLHEGQRRKERGTDVVVGFVETYSRPHTIAAIGDLEVIPRKKINYRGVDVEELDVDAILARRPQVALIDELAHTNVPGSLHEKRYQDVLQIRDAGINVISTVNVQHIESLKDTIEQITGIRVRESLPDWVIDEADEVELVDISPEALQKRMTHGNIYPLAHVESALQHFFRRANLAALRELALRRVLDHTDRQLHEYMRRQGIEGPWHCNETVLVAVPPTGQAQQIVRRGVSLADRLKGRFVVLYVARPGRELDPKRSRAYQEVQKALALARELGAEVMTREGEDVADAIVQVASEVNATQIVLGESTRSWLREVLRGSITREVLQRTKDVDVHIVQRTESR